MRPPTHHEIGDWIDFQAFQARNAASIHMNLPFLCIPSFCFQCRPMPIWAGLSMGHFGTVRGTSKISSGGCAPAASLLRGSQVIICEPSSLLTIYMKKIYVFKGFSLQSLKATLTPTKWNKKTQFTVHWCLCNSVLSENTLSKAA